MDDSVNSYYIINSEIGNIYCYYMRTNTGAYYYKEFFSGYQCYIHDSFDDDYPSITFYADNNIRFDIGMSRKYSYSKEDFALSLESYIEEYGSMDRAKDHFMNIIKERELKAIDAKARTNKNILERARKELIKKQKANNIINKYGIE